MYREHHRALPISSVAPFPLFVVVACLSAYILMTNDYFVEQVLLRAGGRAGSREELEAVARAREATELVIHNPAALIFIALTVGFVSARSLLLVFLVASLFISLVSSQRSRILGCWRSFAASTWVLTLGILVNTLGKLAFADVNFVLGPSLLLHPFDNASPVHSLARASDCFVLYFLMVFSRKASVFYGDTMRLTVALSVCSLLLVELACTVAGVRFAITF